MKKENRMILKVVAWQLVILFLWLISFWGGTTKSLHDFDVKIMLLATGLCILFIGYVIANEK